jgi:hypothetical protein
VVELFSITELLLRGPRYDLGIAILSFPKERLASVQKVYMHKANQVSKG